MSDKNKELCLALMHAESADDIIEYLSVDDYWDDSSVWRYLGDNENNFATVGNQQGDPVAALVEKIVNSNDALLLGECRARGIDPEGGYAPPSPLHAVARFFEGRDLSQFDPAQDGQVAFWHDERVRDVASRLTVTATGAKPPGNPSISIADAGEGQAPDSFPDTLLSLGKSNKLRIPFVQGKFNMGGTGALQFCGTPQNFQLIVSKRRQDVIGDEVYSARSTQWGFTILRRRDPRGSQRNSVYEYLAPGGLVLSFDGAEFGLFPDEATGEPYGRKVAHGTLIKLYSYGFGGNRSSITATAGLARRIDATLSRAVLPARYLDARYPTRSGAFDSRLNGFGVETLLQRRRNELLEPSFPYEEHISVDGARLTVRVYAFSPMPNQARRGRDRAEIYRPRSKAVAYVINGQTHASQDTSFFASSRVGLDYIRHDLFVTVDCTPLPGRAREDLFMNSRDRMRDVPLRRQLVAELEGLLKDHPALRALNEKRRDALRHESESATLVRDLIERMLRDHPELQRILLGGHEIRPIVDPPSPPPFEGKEFPTYFDLEHPKVRDGIGRMAVAANSSLRIRFRTDAEDGYFTRLNDPGSMSIEDADSGRSVAQEFSRTGPVSGTCTITTRSLFDDYAIGDVITLRVVISDNDPLLRPPFQHIVQVTLKDETSSPGPPSPAQPRLDLPPVTEVWKDQPPRWSDFHDPPDVVFDHRTAVQIRRNATDQSPSSFDVFINMDNANLDRARRRSKQPEEVARLNARWRQVFELLTLALLSDHNRAMSESGDNHQRAPWHDESPGQFVYHATRAIAPLVPVLDEVFLSE